MLRTAFWQRAARSLPAAVRRRHAAELEQAERVDLAVGALLAFCRRIEAALARRVHAELLR
jgi:hypothetical protein